MALERICTIEKTNFFLKEYIPHFNEKFTLSINPNKSVFEKLEPDVNLSQVLARLSTRTVQKGHCIKYQNKLYQTYEKERRVFLQPKTKVMVIETLDQQLFVSVSDKIYGMEEVLEQEAWSKELDPPQETTTRQYKSSLASHPWK